MAPPPSHVTRVGLAGSKCTRTGSEVSWRNDTNTMVGQAKALLVVDCKEVPGQFTEHAMEANGGPVNHDIIQVDGHTWDPGKDGGRYFWKQLGAELRPKATHNEVAAVRA